MIKSFAEGFFGSSGWATEAGFVSCLNSSSSSELLDLGCALGFKKLGTLLLFVLEVGVGEGAGLVVAAA